MAARQEASKREERFPFNATQLNEKESGGKNKQRIHETQHFGQIEKIFHWPRAQHLSTRRLAM